jgi:hypothetical protein
VCLHWWHPNLLSGFSRALLDHGHGTQVTQETQAISQAKQM